MSIHPVRLSEWFFYGHKQHDICIFICKVTRCLACGGKVRFRRAWGHHSLPYGYGGVWCREKCMESGRTARPDRRLANRLRRKYADCKTIMIPLIMGGVMDPNELRKLADGIEPHMYGAQQVIPYALRQAADEIDRLRLQVQDMDYERNVETSALLDKIEWLQAELDSLRPLD